MVGSADVAVAPTNSNTTTLSPYSRGHTEPAGGRYDGAPVVVEDVRVMTDQIVTSGFTLLAVVVGLCEERWVRT